MDNTTRRFLSMWRTTSTTTTTKSPKSLEANHEEPMRNRNSNRNDNINNINNNRDLSYWNRWMTFKNRLLTSKPGSLLSLSSSTTTTATTGASITATSLDWREAQELITVLRRTNSSAYTTIDTKTEPTTTTSTTGTRSSSQSSSLSWQLERLESMFQVLDRMCLEVEYVNGTMQQPKQQQPTTTRGSTQKTLTFCLDGGILGATLVSWRDFVLSSSLLSSSDMITHYMRTTTLTAATTTTTTTTTSIGLDPISIWNRLERYHHAGLFLVRPPAYAILLHVMSKILQKQKQHIHNDNNNNNNSSSSLSLSALSQQPQKQQQEQQQQYELLEDMYLYHAQLIHQTLLLRSNYNPHDKIHHPTSATIYGLMQVWANCSRKNHYHHYPQQEQYQQEQYQQEQYQQEQYQQQAPYQVEQLLRTLQQWYQQTKRQDQQPTANLFCTVMEVFVKNHHSTNNNIINQYYYYNDKNHYDNKNEKHCIRNVGFDDNNNNNGLGDGGTLLFGDDGIGTTTTNHTNPTTTTTTTASSETIFHHIVTLYKEMQQTCPDWTCGLINARVCHVLATCCNNNNHTTTNTTNTTNTVAKMAANWAHTLYVQQCHRYQDNQYNTYYKPNPHTLSSVLIAYGRTGQVQQATELFHFMDQWSEVVEQQQEEEEWYNNNNEKDQQQKQEPTRTRIQQQHEQQQQQPTTKTKRQELEEEEQKRRYASQCRRALKPNFICCSTLLWVYAKVGDTQRAEDMLHRMIHDLEQDSGGGSSSSSGYDDNDDNHNHHNHDTKALLWDAQMWHGVLTAWATSGNPKAPEYMTQIIERLRLLQSQEQQQVQQEQEEMNGPYNIVNVTMYNKLLGCYANQHKVEKAEELFHWMESCYQSNNNNNDNTTKQVLVAAPNAESYLAMILAWSKVGNPERCEWYLRKYCNSILRFPQQQQPHDDYYDDKVNHDHHHNIGIHNNHHHHQKHFGVVMDTWAKSKHPQAVVKAQAIFDWMQQELQIQPSAVIYTSLMWAWVYSDMKQMGDPAPHVIRLLEEMKYNYHLKMKQGDWIGAIAIQPTDHIYNAVLSALSKSKNQPQSLNQAIHLFREMAIRNSSSSDHNNNNQHHPHPHDIPSPNVQHYTTIMNACSKHNRPDLAEQFFQELKRNIEQENNNNNNNRNHREQNHFVHGVVAMTGDLSAVYRTRVEAWAQAGDPEMTTQALEEWIADYYYHDDDNSSVVSSFTSFSSSSCVNGRRIRLQDPPRLQDWSAILRAWLRSNRPDAAERADDVLRQQFQHLLPPSPLRPDHDDDDQQQQQQQQQERISLPPTKGIVVVDDSHCLNTRSFDTVISAYAKSNSPQAGENALRLFRDLKRLKAATTTAASSSSSTTGSNADMEQENHLEPTLVTYSGVIVALSRSSCCCSYQQDSKLNNPKQYSHEIQVLLNELKTKNIKFWSLVRTPERLLAMMKRTIDSTSSLLPNKHALQMTLSNLDSILATTTRTTTNSNRTITHHHAKKKQDGQRQPSFSR